MLSSSKSRGAAAIACLVALVCGYAPAQASAIDDNARVMALLNTGCNAQPKQVAQFNPATPTPSPSTSPSASGSPGTSPTPSASPFPTFQPPNSTTTIVQTPRPAPGSVAPGTPPPIPTPTPNAFDQNQPVLLQRGGNTPPPITPAGQLRPTPTAEPTGVPTLKPNGIAILADKVTGNTNQGEPGDADGNVHILYGAEEIVGDHAHYDGLRTVTITGHPFIENHAQDSVLLADEIVFDTIDQTAKLTNGRGTSSEGVERGLVHFQSKDLHTDPDGIGHGLAPLVTTCENYRSGYHMTGRNMDVYPGDKIVIYRAILWLGAAAVFWLPKVVIPLRTVDDSNRPKYFPDVGYDQYEGFWVKTRVTFGRDQYYYGYYTVNYYTKVGTGLGYDATIAKRSGHRNGTIHFYTINDKRVSSRQNNFAATENENFSQTLRGTFGLSYVSNFGPYTNLPATTGYTGTVTHAGTHAQQSYGFSYNSVGTQSKSGSYSFTDSRQFKQNLSNTFALNLADSSTTISSNVTTHVNDVTHLTTSAADYMMTIDKTFAQQPYSISKLPELQISPYHLFSNFHTFPIVSKFTIGEYSEPTDVNFGGNAFATQRADLAFNFGPMIERIAGSDFQAAVNVNQFAYGTGDMKASIQQNMSLTTPLFGHVVNTLTYNESNYNGPSSVPFQTLDQQSTLNSKAAQDLVRIFNGATYNVSLGFSTYFTGVAQPVTYQVTFAPTSRSIVLLSGNFSPGPAGTPGTGFNTTNLQTSFPFGRDAAIQFVGDLDWKNKGRVENKTVYYTKTIGGCYQLQALYNQSLKLVTISINILAFPSRSATFNVGQSGPLIPTTLNF